MTTAGQGREARGCCVQLQMGCCVCGQLIGAEQRTGAVGDHRCIVPSRPAHLLRANDINDLENHPGGRPKHDGKSEAKV